MQAMNRGGCYDAQGGDYCSRCGAWRGSLGLEPTIDLYVAHLVEIFQEVRRVLRKDGTVWINLGDSYNGSSRTGLKAKDLCGIPWRVAFALQTDGWYLRSDIVWCLSGGTRVYARTQKGEVPMMIKDLVRLRPETVKLWNGVRWTQALGWSETPRKETVEIRLRSGEVIGCTPHHEWPTQRGRVAAFDLRVGDVIDSTPLPEPERPKTPMFVPDDIGRFVGIYLADGSRSCSTIQIASHLCEEQRVVFLRDLAERYGGSVHIYQISPNGMTINVESRVLAALVDTYISGRDASTKHLNVECWKRSNAFLSAVLRGYLEGDGYYDEKNARWRLRFTANDALAVDLRTLAARLGVWLRLSRTNHMFNGRAFPGWRGQLRFEKSGHHNEKADTEVIAIRRSRARKFWHIGVADEPHTFALASGVLTYNSKPNTMPESVTDRPTKAHEYLFLLAKSARYFYDAEAVREPAEYGRREWTSIDGNMASVGDERGRATVKGANPSTGHNKRTVWTIATQPFPGAHFSTFPEALVEPCIRAGTSAKGVCRECGAPWKRITKRVDTGRKSVVESLTVGWRPTCEHEGEPVPATVLDPFCGAGTTLLVATKLGRHSIGIDLSGEYADMARNRMLKFFLEWARKRNRRRRK